MTSNCTIIRDNESLLLFVAVGFSLVAYWKREKRLKQQRSHLDQKIVNPPLDDVAILKRAQQYRLELEPPLQSGFRVVAILLLESGEMVFGTNDEPSANIAISMCAERCAFLRYRAQQLVSSVRAVYIVTDADCTVAPGTGCREFMYGHPATSPRTRFILQSNNPKSDPLILSLADLHPFPSIYSGLQPSQQQKLGENIQESIRLELEQLQIEGLSQANLIRFIKAARDACQWDARDSLHPTRYGAAIAIEHGGGKSVEIIQASQIKALEYSSTLDAVCQLASKVLTITAKESTKPRVLAVLQVDQFGIPHGLFAHARAFFVEHGLGDCPVILTAKIESNNNHSDFVAATSYRVRTVPSRELAPFVPEFRSRR